MLKDISKMVLLVGYWRAAHDLGLLYYGHHNTSSSCYYSHSLVVQTNTGSTCSFLKKDVKSHVLCSLSGVSDIHKHILYIKETLSLYSGIF